MILSQVPPQVDQPIDQNKQNIQFTETTTFEKLEPMKFAFFPPLLKMIYQLIT